MREDRLGRDAIQGNQKANRGHNGSHYQCLIVDDEAALSESTCEYFTLFGVSTAWVASAAECLAFLEQNRVDLLLLDINLGDTSGFELCKRLRQEWDLPILFISARRSDDDILLALSLGGDDYIQKPYALSVLLAKAKVMLKRCSGDSVGTVGGATDMGSSAGDAVCAFGDFTINFKQHRVYRSEADGILADVGLTAMEFKLLNYLVLNRGRLIPKDELFGAVWGSAITGDGTLNVHIRRLREKLERDPNNPRWIRTVWGSGYIFEEGA